MAQPKLNVVIPVYNEIEIVDQLHTRVVAACSDCDIDFRIIYVDDGSKDGTAEWIQQNAVYPLQTVSPMASKSRHDVTLIQLSGSPLVRMTTWKLSWLSSLYSPSSR